MTRIERLSTKLDETNDRIDALDLAMGSAITDMLKRMETINKNLWDLQKRSE